MTSIDRIREMEEILDEAAPAVEALCTALEAYENLYEKIRKLEGYYSGGQWMRDYEADELGKLPKELKRGVLSEDAIYDLLADEQAMKERLCRLEEKLTNH